MYAEESYEGPDRDASDQMCDIIWFAGDSNKMSFKMYFMPLHISST